MARREGLAALLEISNLLNTGSALPRTPAKPGWAETRGDHRKSHWPGLQLPRLRHALNTAVFTFFRASWGPSTPGWRHR